jgi:glycosyltransferase involved in cell wall biosynthesis
MSGQVNTRPPRRPETERRIALDASPLLGRQTGVGESVALVLAGLATQEHDYAVALFANALRHPLVLPDGLAAAYPHLIRRHWPNRWLLRAWEHLAWPPVEYLTGPLDLFHATNFFLPPLKQARGVVTIHDLYFLKDSTYGETLGGQWFRRVLPASLERAAAIIVPSQATAQAVAEFFPRYSGRVHVIPWGLKDRPRPGPGQGDPPTIIAVGTIEPRKDYPLMLRAAALLRDRGVSFRLKIAGCAGWEERPLRILYRELCLEGVVEFLGYLGNEALERLYEQARLFVSTSRDEGFGLPLLHALAHGVPAAVAEAGALPEVLGPAGLAVPERLPEAHAAAWEQMLTDEALYQRCSEAAREQASVFSLERLGRAHLDLYARLLE